MSGSKPPDNLYTRVLRPETAEAYSVLMPTVLRPWLRRLEDPAQVAAGAALVWVPASGPTGLAVARLRTEHAVADLSWIFVRPAERGRGVGSAVLAELENEVLRRGYRKLRASYRYPAAGPVRRFTDFLERNGWALAEPAFLRCEGRAEVLGARWMNLRVPASLQIVPWHELRDEERGELERSEVRTENGPRIHGFPSPLAAPDRVEPRASFWVRWRGRLVGWLTTQRINDTTIRLDSLYAAPEFRTTGQAIPVISVALRAAYDAGYRRALFEVRCDNERMVRFVRRRLIPEGVVVREFCKAEKELEPVRSEQTAWTTELVDDVKVRISRRASWDPDFRRTCLVDPGAAVREVSGMSLPESVPPVRFVVGDDGLVSTEPRPRAPDEIGLEDFELGEGFGAYK